MNAYTVEQKLLDAVTASGAGAGWTSEDYDNLTFVIRSSGTVSATIEIQAWSDELGDWFTIDTQELTTAGDTIVRDATGSYQQIRANVTTYSSGTFTVVAIGRFEE